MASSDPDFDKRPLKPLSPAVRIITCLAMKELSPEEMLQVSKSLEIFATEQRLAREMESGDEWCYRSNKVRRDRI